MVGRGRREVLSLVKELRQEGWGEAEEGWAGLELCWGGDRPGHAWDRGWRNGRPKFLEAGGQGTEPLSTGHP